MEEGIRIGIVVHQPHSALRLTSPRRSDADWRAVFASVSGSLWATNANPQHPIKPRVRRIVNLLRCGDHEIRACSDRSAPLMMTRRVAHTGQMNLIYCLDAKADGRPRYICQTTSPWIFA